MERRVVRGAERQTAPGATDWEKVVEMTLRMGAFDGSFDVKDLGVERIGRRSGGHEGGSGCLGGKEKGGDVEQQMLGLRYLISIGLTCQFVPTAIHQGFVINHHFLHSIPFKTFGQ